jgi:ribosomal protein S18 acetylase RimI-like enzyme
MLGRSRSIYTFSLDEYEGIIPGSLAMEFAENPFLPSGSDLSWSPLQAADAGEVRELASLCLSVDGGQTLGAEEMYIKKYYFPTASGESLGAFEQGGQLVASAAIQPDHTAKAYLVVIVGQVHPEFRQRGIGHTLLAWCIEKASRILAACPTDRAHILQIRTESLTPEAVSLYKDHGFIRQFAEDVMRRDLSDPFPDILLSDEIHFATWEKALVDQFFAVYQESFPDQPGFPNWSQEQWVAWLEPEDEEFQPGLSLLACHEELPVGFIVCAENFIVQMGVVPDWRGRGIGSALLIEVLTRYNEKGVDHVLLDVNVNNARAARVYANLGFKVSGRRARYEKVCE